MPRILLLFAALVLSTVPARGDPPATAPTTRPVNGDPNALAVAQRRARQVGLGLIMCANDNRGRLPDHLGDAVKYTGGSAAVFVTPGDERRLGPPPKPATADWVNDHASFTYLAAGVKYPRIRTPATVVVIHSKLDDPFEAQDGGHVVVLGYADGHVALLPPAEAATAIAASVKALAGCK